jgi:hypothetical protein
MSDAHVEAILARLRPLVEDGPVIVAGGPLAGMQPRLTAVRALGARRPLCVAFGLGTGPLPAEEDADRFVVPQEEQPLLESIYEEMRLLADPPPDLRAALDAYDPECRAVVLAGPFLTAREVAGRRVLDGRLPAWEAIEDKTLSEALWNGAGIVRAPSRVVPATDAALRAAARGLDLGEGTVWAGDAREGFNGGSEFVRRIVTPTDEAQAVAFFTAHCDRVRVMPFLDGIPTSIHGLVFPDGVAVFRPVEMIILRRPPEAPSGFVVGGLSTWWDPQPHDRAEMRECGRRIGLHLRDSIDYRGGFSLDGIMTRDGFRPTEVNPRFSAGLNTLVRGLPELPLIGIQCALVSGADPGVTAAELEELVVIAADERRSGSAATLTTAVHPRATDERRVVLEDRCYRLAGDDEPDDGTLSVGPSAVGGLVRLDPNPARLTHGMSMAPLAVAAFRLADEIWGTAIGPTQAAPSLR